MSAPDTPDILRRPARTWLQTAVEAAVLLAAPIALISCYLVFHSEHAVVERPAVHEITARNMAVLDRRVANHVRRHGWVPSLDDVTFEAPPVDGYGQPLELERVSPKKWEIWSRDGGDMIRAPDEVGDVSWSTLRERFDVVGSTPVATAP